jgi:hypothetical protein
MSNKKVEKIGKIGKGTIVLKKSEIIKQKR